VNSRWPISGILRIVVPHSGISIGTLTDVRETSPVRRFLLVLGVLLLVALAIGPVVPRAFAAPTVSFAQKFSANASGAIITVGNNLLTCPASAANCTAARGGAARDDNEFAMVNLDADDDASTRNSSMSRLDLPAGATVLWAGVYWGARLQAGAQGQGGNAANINRMSLRVPGSATYQSVLASADAHDLFGPNSGSYDAYQRFANVTAIVRAAGNGEYWGANVEAATGADRYAGWALVVAYSAPGLPLRNLTVFDGFNVVGAGAPQTVTVSGFLAPRSGTVDTQLSMIAFEGDLAQTGDYTRLNSTQLATALSPGSNFFDSANGLNGVSVTSRTPADRNMLGFDIKNLGASGAIANGATSATFMFSSNGDVYYPGVLTTAINLYAPDFSASSKSVVDLNGNTPARPGDTLQYTLTYVNTGQDPAVQLASSDPLPAGTTYVPGSLQRIPALGAMPVPVTDAGGDDVGEYDAASRTVRVRLGDGASATAGGTMPVNGWGAYTFRVTLDDAAGGTTVSNLATLDYRTGTTGIPASYSTNPAAVDVINRANLSITKTMTPDPASVGSEITGTITITNAGPNAATDVVMRDPIIDGWTNASMDAPLGTSCTVDTVITCSAGTLAPGASVTFRAHGSMAPGTIQPTLTNLAYASTTAFDPDLTDNVASDTINLLRVADVSIAKTATPASAPAGATVSYTLTVRNAGPSNAQDVVISDAVANAAQISLTRITGTTGGATCPPAPQAAALQCSVPTLAPEATATVTVEGVLRASLNAGSTVANTANVTAGTADPDSANNQATGQVTTSAGSADLQLAKTAPASVVAGSPIAYTITASDLGPSDSQATTLTDDVPVGITATSVSTDRGTCSIQAETPSPGRQRVLCAFPSLPAPVGGAPAAAATITVNGTVAADVAADTIDNTASIQSITADPAPGNNSATATTVVTRAFDLAVTKRANRASLPAASPGNPRPVDYTITVTNNGPSAAIGVTLDDLVPAALVFVSASPDGGGSCTAPEPADPAHHRISCTLAGAVPVGGTRTVQVHMRAESDLSAAGAPVTETVTVTTVADTNAANNTATWTLSGAPYSDLELRKTAPATVTAGTMVTYTFDVTNHPIPPDSITALAPTIEDTLPDGVTLVAAGAPGSVTPEWCTADGQDVTCQMPAATWDIDPDATRSLSISVRIAADAEAGSTLLNTADVINRPSNPDPAPANNAAQATSTVVADADVLITGMTVTPQDPALTGPGSRWLSSFTLRNDGPSIARGVVFRVTTDVNADIDPSTLPDDCAINQGELTCTIDGNDLEPGEHVVIGFAFVTPGYVNAGAHVVDAQVSSSTPDSDLDNNAATAPFVLGSPVTDLEVTKTALDTLPNPDDGHPSYIAGRPFGYQITVAVPNDAGSGLADARDVTLVDPMPDGFTATVVSTTQGNCSVTGGGTGVACQLGTVAAWPGGETPATVTVYGLVRASAEGEQIANTASATSTTADVDGDPSASASASVDVVEQADLRLFKVADSTVGGEGLPTFYAGGQVGYTLTTVNAGPSDVEQASIEDTLPTGLSLVPDDSPGCEVTSGTPATGQHVACTVGAVGVGRSVSIRLVASTRSGDTPRTITNTATVTSQATDPNPDNNTASVDGRIDVIADIAITGSLSTTTPAAGGQLTVTASTINNGPSDAWNVTGTTTFPAGFIPVSWNVPGNDCTVSPEPPADPASAPWEDTQYSLVCRPSDARFPFSPGIGSTQSVVVLQIPGDTPSGAYPIRGSIRTDTPESTYDNNTASASVYVQRVSSTRIEKTLVEPNPMIAGRPATWRLTVTNDGPSVADNVVIADTVPNGMTFVSARVAGADACPAPETVDQQVIVKCPVTSLDVGESTSALVTFDIGDDMTSRELCNAALVGSGSLDPDSGDNEDHACGDAVAPPATDVGLTITADESQEPSGDPVSYTAVAQNNGPADAEDVAIDFDVPDGLAGAAGVLVSAADGTTPQVDCVGSLTCTIGHLAAGQQVTYRITGTAAGPGGSSLLLAGRVTHDAVDTDPANDEAAARIDITAPMLSPNELPSAHASPVPTRTPSPPSGTRRPSLRLSKVADRRRVRTGGIVRYRLRVQNSGRGDAQNMRICDRLPIGLQYVTTGSAHVHDRQACYTLRSLRARSSRTFILRTRAESVARAETLCNTATLTARGLPSRRARACIRVLPGPQGCPALAAQQADAPSDRPRAHASC
jgi:uncharacterized repeat protein (TIGR01451 family)